MMILSDYYYKYYYSGLLSSGGKEIRIFLSSEIPSDLSLEFLKKLRMLIFRLIRIGIYEEQV